MNDYPSLHFEDKMRMATKGMLPMPGDHFVKKLANQFGEGEAEPIWPRRSIGLFSSNKRVFQTMAVVLLLAILLIGPRNVLAYIQRLAGYYPGIGFVQGERFLLEEPVSVTMCGLVITVEQLVVGDERTSLVYTIEIACLMDN